MLIPSGVNRDDDAIRCVAHLAICDVLAVDLQELLCQGLLLLRGRRHHPAVAQGREHWGVDSFWSGGAIRVLNTQRPSTDVAREREKLNQSRIDVYIGNGVAGISA